MLDLPEPCWALLERLERDGPLSFDEGVESAEVPHDAYVILLEGGLVVGGDGIPLPPGGPSPVRWVVVLTLAGQRALAERRLAAAPPAKLGKPKAEEPKPDGPAGPDGFCWEGQSCERLTPKPWRFLDHLWQQPGRKAKLEDLAGPVLLDRNEPVSASAAGSWRREVNRLFERARIPWRAEIANGVAMLTQKPGGQTGGQKSP